MFPMFRALQGKVWGNIGERFRASGNKDELCKLLFGSKQVEAEVERKCRRWGGRKLVYVRMI